MCYTGAAVHSLEGGVENAFAGWMIRFYCIYEFCEKGTVFVAVIASLQI